MGDTFTPISYPLADLSTGGHVDGFIKAADRALALIGDKTQVVGGHGAIGDKKKLKEWRDMIAGVRDQVAAAVKAGKSLAEVKAMKPTAKWDAIYGHGFISPDLFVEELYQDLKGK
jgi:hypothetical protein